MKKTVLLTLFLISVPLVASQPPEHQYTDFYSNEDIAHGEDIILGVQYSEEDNVSNITSSLHSGEKTVDHAIMVDRNEDNFYAGKLEGTSVWEEYRIEIKACNDYGCSTKTHSKSVKMIDWERWFGNDRSPVLP